MPLKMIVSPDGKALLAACSGYNSTGVAVFDLATNKLTQFIPQGKIFNGLAFSRDGSRLFVSGGDSGKIYVYGYKSGKLTTPAKIADLRLVPSPRFLAGIAIHPTTGICILPTRPTRRFGSLTPIRSWPSMAIPTGLHPHTCVFGGDGVHLYVSNWGSRSVSIIDTKSGRQVRDVPGRHPAQRHGCSAGRPALRRLLRATTRCM